MVSAPNRITLQLRSGSWNAPTLTAIAYFLAARFGDLLAFPSAPVPAFWAPSAIVLAALLLSRRDRWWLYLLAILCAHLFAQLPGFPVSQVLIQYLSNISIALIGALALQCLCAAPYRFDRVHSVVVLVVFGGVIAPFVTSVAMAGALDLAGFEGDFWLTVLVHTLTNTFAITALVPLIVDGAAWLHRGHREVPRARVAEAVVLAATLALICTSVFVLPPQGSLHIPVLLYAPLPLLAWSAMRFGVPGTCSAALLLGAISTWGVLHGHGRFTAAEPVHDALSIVAFQAVTTVALVLSAALIRDWKHAQDASRSSETRFRSIFEHNLIPTVIWRDNFCICEANAAFLRLTGFSQADIATGSLRLDHLTDCGDIRDRSPGGKLQYLSSTERELRLRDGRRIPVVLGYGRFGDGTGGVLYALDLSALRHAEARRAKAESPHAAVLASLNEQIAILDNSGVVVEINDSWRRSVESAPVLRFDHTLPGENLLDACTLAAKRGDRAAAEQLTALRAVLSGTEVRRQFESTDGSGEAPKWIEISVEKLRRLEGGIVVTRADVTARKQAELEAQNQRLQLAHLERAAILGQLSGAFAHELKQPLTSILGNAEAGLCMLARGSIDVAELQEILTDIVQDDERATQVIERLRALLEKGNFVLTPVDLNQVIHEVLELVRSELITRNVTAITDFDARAPPVLADCVQMQQVILNLLMNACEAMSSVPAAERRITLTTRFDEADSYVEARICDTGCGIAAAERERIFQPFVTTKRHGMGLGLPICRSMAETHGGSLWAESVAGAGASFCLRLPMDGGAHEAQ